MRLRNKGIRAAGVDDRQLRRRAAGSYEDRGDPESLEPTLSGSLRALVARMPDADAPAVLLDAPAGPAPVQQPQTMSELCHQRHATSCLHHTSSTPTRYVPVRCATTLVR
jgi:hypothetical protein